MVIWARTIRSFFSQTSLVSSARIPHCYRFVPYFTLPGLLFSAGNRGFRSPIHSCFGSLSSSCSVAASNPSQISISVRTSQGLGGALHGLTVDPADTVESLKSVMRSRSLIPMDDYLIYSGERLLADEYTLVHYGIKQGDLLSVHKAKTFLIQVHLEGPDTLVLRADLTETVGSLKAKIKMELAHMGIYLKTPTIYYNRRRLDEDDRRLVGYAIMKQPPRKVVIDLAVERSLEDTGPHYIVHKHQQPDLDVIEPQTVLPLVARYSSRMQIIVFVELPRFGIRIPLNVTPKDTIDDLMALIPLKISGMNLLMGDEKKQLCKHYGGGSTLEAWGIKDQDTLVCVTARAFAIKIKIPGQDTMTCRGGMKDVEYFTKYVECSDTIGMVKSKIQEKTGILIELQRLKYHGWWLDDDTKTLADYGIYVPEFSYTLLLFPSLSPAGQHS